MYLLLTFFSSQDQNLIIKSTKLYARMVANSRGKLGDKNVADALLPSLSGLIACIHVARLTIRFSTWQTVTSFLTWDKLSNYIAFDSFHWITSSNKVHNSVLDHLVKIIITSNVLILLLTHATSTLWRQKMNLGKLILCCVTSSVKCYKVLNKMSISITIRINQNKAIHHMTLDLKSNFSLVYVFNITATIRWKLRQYFPQW